MVLSHASSAGSISTSQLPMATLVEKNTWKIPEINNLQVFNCMPFFITWRNLVLVYSVPPGSSVVALSTPPAPESLRSCPMGRWTAARHSCVPRALPEAQRYVTKPAPHAVSSHRPCTSSRHHVRKGEHSTTRYLEIKRNHIHRTFTAVITVIVLLYSQLLSLTSYHAYVIS